LSRTKNLNIWYKLISILN